MYLYKTTEKIDDCREAPVTILRRCGYGLVFITVLMGSVCCTKSGKNSGIAVSRDGPGQKVRSIIILANRGLYNEISADVVYAVVATLDTGIRSGEDWTFQQKRSFWEAVTRHGTVSGVVISREIVRERFARVKCRIEFRDGTSREHLFEMHLSGDGRWVLPVYLKMLKQ